MFITKQTKQITNMSTMKCGTRVVLIADVVGASQGDVGMVTSYTKNGWLRVTIDITNKIVSVRNSEGNIIRWKPDKYSLLFEENKKPLYIAWYDQPRRTRLTTSPSPLRAENHKNC